MYVYTSMYTLYLYIFVVFHIFHIFRLLFRRSPLGFQTNVVSTADHDLRFGSWTNDGHDLQWHSAASKCSWEKSLGLKHHRTKSKTYMQIPSVLTFKRLKRCFQIQAPYKQKLPLPQQRKKTTKENTTWPWSNPPSCSKILFPPPSYPQANFSSEGQGYRSQTSRDPWSFQSPSPALAFACPHGKPCPHVPSCPQSCYLTLQPNI